MSRCMTLDQTLEGFGEENTQSAAKELTVPPPMFKRSPESLRIVSK